MKTILNATIGFYFGAILSVVGFPFYTWQFWAIFVPVTIGYWILIGLYRKEVV